MHLKQTANLLTVQIVALKFIPKLNKSAEDLLALQREVNIMRELRHENIIALYDWFETDTEVNGELGAGLRRPSIPALCTD